MSKIGIIFGLKHEGREFKGKRVLRSVSHLIFFHCTKGYSVEQRHPDVRFREKCIIYIFVPDILNAYSTTVVSLTERL